MNHVIVTAQPGGSYYYPQFTQEESEVQREDSNLPKVTQLVSQERENFDSGETPFPLNLCNKSYWSLLSTLGAPFILLASPGLPATPLFTQPFQVPPSCQELRKQG